MKMTHQFPKMHIKYIMSNVHIHMYIHIHIYMYIYIYGRCEGTSSVAFEVLIIKSEIDFMNMFIFNCLMSNFCFPKNMFFASKRERMFMDTLPQLRVFNSTREMMSCYFRDTNKFLRYRTLCTNILKCKFPTKGIELTLLEFFEGPRVPQL